jgi:hypothetical protein
MPRAEEQSVFSELYRQIREAIDQDWLDAGATREELELSRRLGDLFARELESGRTPEEINADWDGKSAEEILAEYALPSPIATLQAS